MKVIAPGSSLPVVFNIAFWQINDKDGYYVNPLTEDYVLTAVAEMNREFNQHGIFFKYRGLNEINSPEDVVYKQKIDADGDGTTECTTLDGPDPDGFMRLSQCQLGALSSFVNANNYKVANSFNVYVPYSTTDFGGSSGGSRLTFNRGGVTGSGLVHELGHSFSLHHLHGTGNNDTDWRSDDPTKCEHVTRDTSLEQQDDLSIPYYNALSKGDREHDTSAVPNFNKEYCHFNGLQDTDCGSGSEFQLYNVDADTCTYIEADNTDCQGTIYDIFDADVRNYMAYTRKSCMSTFSPDQVAKMQNRVLSQNYLNDLEAPISSLYEPYKGEYEQYTEGSNIYDHVKFQPGFEYKFYRCQNSYPLDFTSEYGDTSFSFDVHDIVKFVPNDEENYSSIFHPNHTAISIKEVDLANQYLQVQKCYDNWTGPPIIGGSIVDFIDNTFNANVKITTKDSTGITNPNLINDLDPGLYKVVKNFGNGTQEETVIIKGN